MSYKPVGIDEDGLLPPRAREAISQQTASNIATPGTPEQEALNGAIAPVEARLAHTGRVFAVGDSNTAYQVSAATGQTSLLQAGLQYGRDSWITHAILNSDAKWTFSGVAATPSWTAAQILATHVPAVIAAAQPGDTVVVFAGTNGTVLADVIAIHETFRAAGLRTVGVLIPPSTAAGVSTIAKFNRQLASYLQSKGIPVADVHAAVVDPATGEYLSAYDNDGVHPNGAGYRLFGETIAATLEEMFSALPNPLVRNNAQMDGYLASKPLALGDPADGTDYGRHSASGTATVVADSDFAGGSCYQFTQTNADTAFVSRLSYWELIPGHRYRVGMRVKTSVPVGTEAYQVAVQNLGNNESLFIFPVNGGQANYPADGAFYLDVTAPTTLTAGQNWRVKVTINNGSAWVRLGEITVIDLDQPV